MGERGGKCKIHSLIQHSFQTSSQSECVRPVLIDLDWGKEGQEGGQDQERCIEECAGKASKAKGRQEDLNPSQWCAKVNADVSEKSCAMHAGLDGFWISQFSLMSWVSEVCIAVVWPCAVGMSCEVGMTCIWNAWMSLSHVMYFHWCAWQVLGAQLLQRPVMALDLDGFAMVGVTRACGCSDIVKCIELYCVNLSILYFEPFILYVR